MVAAKKRIVLFLPHRADPAQGVRVSADLLPLELLQIAAFPDREGYEVVIIDAMVHDDYMARLMEACDGALLFGSSCILGYQVTHGAEVARAVRERFPQLPIIWGGWFPSVLPERYFVEGIADAVCLGQGEITFWEVVQALESGEDLANVPGLVVERDGKPVYTEHRPVVGFDKIPDAPWHLIDFEEYVARQNDTGQLEGAAQVPGSVGHEGRARRAARLQLLLLQLRLPRAVHLLLLADGHGAALEGDPGQAARGTDHRAATTASTSTSCASRTPTSACAEKRSNEFCDALIENGSARSGGTAPTRSRRSRATRTSRSTAWPRRASTWLPSAPKPAAWNSRRRSRRRSTSRTTWCRRCGA